MPGIRQVQMAEAPPWHSSRILDAVPGEVELSLEGYLVHVRLHGNGSGSAHLRMRLGRHFAIREWQALVFDDAPPKK